MISAAARPLLLDPKHADDPCAHCDARGVSVCNAVPASDLARLAAAATVLEAAPGKVFIEEGEPAGYFCNITAGTARIFKLLPDGRRQITGFVGMGHFLGLAVSDTFAFSAEAIDTVRYCRFPRARLRTLLADFPALEKRLLEVAQDELVAAQEQMLLLGRKTALERLASFLLAQSRQGSPCQHARARFHLPMPRGDIADYLGLTIETVSRTMTRLRSLNLIDLPTPAEVVIRDAAGLRRLAEGDAH
jgi:CRP/FNR family transcriptional regulator